MLKEIRLDCLRMPVRIGIHEFELAAAQPYEIDFTLQLQADYVCKKDAISEAVNYDKLRSVVSAHLSSKHFNLQETLVQEVMQIAFAVDSRICGVEIYARKPTVYPDCASVGLRYRLSRQEFEAS